ncbi:MAG: mercury resistance system transport protein MerF [Candidatus Rokuibacteriota bacterium]
MRRDRWFSFGVIGATLACRACLTPAAVVLLGAVGLGAWTGRADPVLLTLLVGFVALAAYRCGQAAPLLDRARPHGTFSVPVAVGGRHERRGLAHGRRLM